jgi:hypothetical protein
MMTYLARFWLALDILLNVILGGDVETMSSRMGRAILQGRRCVLCRFTCRLLDVFWPGHCVHNIMEPFDK